MPRRRWVGSTVTAATADAGSAWPPGTVSSVAQDRNVPQIRSPSNAAQVRPGSQTVDTCSATRSPSGRSRKPVPMART